MLSYHEEMWGQAVKTIRAGAGGDISGRKMKEARDGEDGGGGINRGGSKEEKRDRGRRKKGKQSGKQD